MLRICLLGPFRVERDGETIPHRAWARPKDRALLKLLALDLGHLVPQDRLLDALWPDLEPASAANSLHASVSRLRKLLGPAPLIRHDAAGYTLAAPDAVWVDIEEFRRLLGRAREWRRLGAWGPAAQAYRAAAALYRGDLFEDDPYVEWALRPREQMREAHLALLEELADCLVHVGAPAEALSLIHI